MNVIISQNIKKESVRINPAGDIINAKTKQVIQPVEPEYMPPSVPTSTTADPIPDTFQSKPPSKIDEMISKKIEEIINRKIEEALKNL